MTRKVILVLMLVALGLMVVPTTMAQDLGTAENPIQVYFVPSAEAQVLISGGEVIREALAAATGLEFEVFVPTSYAATIEAICAAPDKSIGFIPPAGYVLANNRCGVEVEAAAVRFGWPVYWAQYIVARDSDIYTLGDLEGKTWAYGDPSSTSGFIVPSVEFADAEIEYGDTLETGGHNQTVLAVYNGEADFGTTYFSPPRMPGADWDFGDLPEPYDLTIDQSYLNDEGRLYVGDIRIMDARSAVRETAPDVVDRVRILRLSAPIPNDTMSFGPDFPVELRMEIFEALVAFAETEAWEESALGSDDGYSWDGLALMDDAFFDSVRLQMDVLGYTEDDIFGG